MGPVEVRAIEPETVSFQAEASSAPRLEVVEALDSVAELSERDLEDATDDQEEPMLDPNLPQKRIEFPRQRKAVAKPVIAEPPREPSPVPVRALREEPVSPPAPSPSPLPARAPSPVPERAAVERPAPSRGREAIREPAVREEPSVRPQALSESRERPMSAWRVALVTLLTAGASFALVRFLIVPSEVPEGPIQASTAPPTVAAPPPPVAKKPKKVEAAPAALSSEEGDLPADAVIDADKGLLEVEIGDKRAIYVDGTFVGLGPRRRVPLAPGKHEVKLREGGDETTHAVEIRAGRSTRLSKSQP